MATFAADGIPSMDLVLFHGNKKHNITVRLSSEEEGERLLVEHLAKHVEQVTEVPIDKQKLIFKGKSLVNPKDLLGDLGISKGCKIMLVGRKPSVEVTDEEKEIIVIQQEFQKNEKKLSEISYQLDGLKRGFIPKGTATDLGKMLSTQLSGLAEGNMKLLERLDGLNVGEGNTKARAERKKMVDKIQKHLQKCDDLSVHSEQAMKNLVLNN